MADRRHRLALRIAAASVLVVLVALAPKPLGALGNSGVFHPRALSVGGMRVQGPRASAPARWAWELTRRTSAPARLAPETVRADSSALLAEPFAYWFGESDVGELASREVLGLRLFLSLGGTLLIDDSEPERGEFGRSVRRELARVVPDSAPIAMGTENVVFRSYYLLRRAYGRVEGPPKLEAIVRNGVAQVIFSSHDLAGALAQSADATPALAVTPGGEHQREMATRLAINIAMFVLCSNYKDDQVHAPYLMRRRARDLP